MRAAAIRREPMPARRTNLTFKGSDLVQAVCNSYGGGFQVTGGLEALLPTTSLSWPRAGSRRLRKDYGQRGIVHSTMVRDLSLATAGVTGVQREKKLTDDTSEAISTWPTDRQCWGRAAYQDWHG